MEYGDSHRALQDRFDTRRLADRLGSVAGDDLTAFRDFIEARDMFFLATADADGHPQCSYKGGDPGFVRVVDDTTLAFPRLRRQRDVPQRRQRRREPARRAALHRLRPRLAAAAQRGGVDRPGRPAARRPPRRQARRAGARPRGVPQLPRYVHTHGPAERSVFVPAAGTQPPVPDWKLDQWFDGTLPEGDPALDATNPSAPSIPRF